MKETERLLIALWLLLVTLPGGRKKNVILASFWYQGHLSFGEYLFSFPGTLALLIIDETGRALRYYVLLRCSPCFWGLCRVLHRFFLLMRTASLFVILFCMNKLWRSGVPTSFIFFFWIKKVCQQRRRKGFFFLNFLSLLENIIGICLISKFCELDSSVCEEGFRLKIQMLFSLVFIYLIFFTSKGKS